MGTVAALAVGVGETANRVLGQNFVTKYGTKQGIIVLGQAVPPGLGAGIGAGGNWLLTRGVIHATRSPFGPPPSTWTIG